MELRLAVLLCSLPTINSARCHTLLHLLTFRPSSAVLIMIVEMERLASESLTAEELEALADLERLNDVSQDYA